MTADEFIAAAQAHANSRAAKGTRYLYNLDLKRWLAHCEATSIDVSRPTLAAATAFRDALQAACAAQTVRRTLSALSSMYAFAIDFEPERPKASCNPFKPLALPRPPARAFTRTEALTDAEARAVIAAAEELAATKAPVGVRDVAILWLLYETGLRVESVVSLPRKALFMREEQLVAHVTVKGGKEVEVEIPQRAGEALAAWMRVAPGSEWAFPARGGKRSRAANKGSLTPKAVNKRLELYGKLAGVVHVHPHRFRASYITAAIDAGVSLVDVQAAAHHEDPKTTLRYDRSKRGAGVADAVAKFRGG